MIQQLCYAPCPAPPACQLPETMQACMCLVAYEEPAITSIVPTSRVIAPTTDVVLHVHGTGFGPYTVIEFADNTAEPTVFVSPTEVTTIIKGNLFTGVDANVPVRVHNGTLVSNTENFAFTAT